MKSELAALAFVLVLLAGCTQDTGPASAQNASTGANASYGAQARDFYLCVVPSPKNSPDSTFADITDAYQETGGIAELSMVWVSPQGIGQLERLKQNKVVTALGVYGVKPVLTLSFATLKQSPGKGLEYVVDAPAGVPANLSDKEFRRQWVAEARGIAQEFKPGYLSLGNEINDYFYLHPEQLDDYLSLYDEARAEIKKVSPGTKVFAVFSYTHMLDNNQSWMLSKFDNRSDLIGLTTYPWKHYSSPGEIPENYYTRIANYTSKPVAFTEIGWVSSSSKGSSEEEQAEFLRMFVNLTAPMDREMVCWLFLHEMDLSSQPAFEPATGTIALKKADGTKKKVYVEWIKLKNLQKR